MYYVLACLRAIVRILCILLALAVAWSIYFFAWALWGQ